jgi:hypothetical protein
VTADTRVVFSKGPRSSFKTGTLKAIVVARHVIICFAGDVLAGLEGVRGFARELGKGRPVDGLFPRLQELASDGRRIVEFIVADGRAGSQLTRVRNSGIECGLQSAWIGDQQGFERFQRERNRPTDSMSALESQLQPATRVMAILRRAMQASLTIRPSSPLAISALR